MQGSNRYFHQTHWLNICHNETTRITCQNMCSHSPRHRKIKTSLNTIKQIKQAQQLQLHESRTMEPQSLQPGQVSQRQRNILSSFRTKRVRCNTRHNKTAHNTYALNDPDINCQDLPEIKLRRQSNCSCNCMNHVQWRRSVCNPVKFLSAIAICSPPAGPNSFPETRYNQIPNNAQTVN